MEEGGDLYSWHEQFYYFTLFRALNGPDATPGKDCNTPIDDDTYYTQADLVSYFLSIHAVNKTNHKGFLTYKMQLA